MNDIRILAINPGSTSTKFAVYFGSECKLKKTLRHSIEDLSLYENIIDQFEFRKGELTPNTDRGVIQSNLSFYNVS